MMDLTGVFDFILFVFVQIKNVMSNDFLFHIYNFSFSLWDFFITLFILSGIVPIVVAPSTAANFSGFVADFHANSERNDKRHHSRESSDLVKKVGD